MKNYLLPLIAAVVLAAAPVHAASTQAPPGAGQPFPNFLLKGQITEAQRAYLGLPVDAGALPLSQIDADLVLVEVFNMYCPHCQREAPNMNILHDLLLKSPNRDKIKLLGVGVGNSQFEVDFFRKEYKVDFPLFEDGDYAVYNSIGKVGTPCFFLVKLPRTQDQKEPKVVLVNEGPFDAPTSFMQRIFKAAGL